jgi:hypothetical protein
MHNRGQDDTSPRDEAGDQENPERTVPGGPEQPTADSPEVSATAGDEDDQTLKEDFEDGLASGLVSRKKPEEIEFQIPSEEALEEEFGPRVRESESSEEFHEDYPASFFPETRESLESSGEEPSPPGGDPGDSGEAPEGEPVPHDPEPLKSGESLQEDFDRRLEASLEDEEFLGGEWEVSLEDPPDPSDNSWSGAGDRPSGRRLGLAALASILVMTGLGVFLYSSGYVSEWVSRVTPGPVERNFPGEAPGRITSAEERTGTGITEGTGGEAPGSITPPAGGVSTGDPAGPSASLQETFTQGETTAPSAPDAESGDVPEDTAGEETSFERLFVEARSHFDNKDYRKAEDIYLQIIKKDPEAGHAYFNLGDVYLEKDEFEKAEEMYREAKRLFGASGN